MTGRRTVGPVEREYRAWIRGLGTLNARQKAAAAQLYALAGQIDSARDSGEPMSAVAAISRELRQLAVDMRDVKATGTGEPDAPPAPPADTVDEIAKRRHERLDRMKAEARNT